MDINIPNEVIEQIVKAQVEGTVRNRIKEMQGNYTSKGFIEDLIKEVIWEKVRTLCPDVEQQIQSEVKRCVNSAFEYTRVNVTKKQLIEDVVENLLEHLMKEE